MTTIVIITNVIITILIITNVIITNIISSHLAALVIGIRCNLIPCWILAEVQNVSYMANILSLIHI